MKTNICNQFFVNAFSLLIPVNRWEAGSVTLIPVALATIPTVGLSLAVCYSGYKYFSKLNREIVSVTPSQNVIPNAIPAAISDEPLSVSIYRSKVPAPSPDMLKPHADKIEILKKRNNVLGIAAVQDKDTQEIIPVYLQAEKEEEGVYFSVHQIDDNLELGHAKVYFVSRDGDFYGNRSLFKGRNLAGDEEEEYGDEGLGFDKCHMTALYNHFKEDTKNVGYLLVKSSLQYFSEKSKARMDFDAKAGSSVFYYKLGFRSKDPEFNVQAASGAQDDWSYMFLPEPSRKEWLKEIEENPLVI